MIQICLYVFYIHMFVMLSKEEFLNGLSKESILEDMSKYLLDNPDIPDDVTAEDIWEAIIDLEILNLL